VRGPIRKRDVPQECKGEKDQTRKQKKREETLKNNRVTLGEGEETEGVHKWGGILA